MNSRSEHIRKSSDTYEKTEQMRNHLRVVRNNVKTIVALSVPILAELCLTFSHWVPPFQPLNFFWAVRITLHFTCLLKIDKAGQLLIPAMHRVAAPGRCSNDRGHESAERKRASDSEETCLKKLEDEEAKRYAIEGDGPRLPS